MAAFIMLPTSLVSLNSSTSGLPYINTLRQLSEDHCMTRLLITTFPRIVITTSRRMSLTFPLSFRFSPYEFSLVLPFCPPASIAAKGIPGYLKLPRCSCVYVCIFSLWMGNGGDCSDALYKPGGLIIEFQFLQKLIRCCSVHRQYPPSCQRP